MKKMSEIGDLVIIVGNNTEVPDGLKNKPVIMGVCQERNQHKGCYA